MSNGTAFVIVLVILGAFFASGWLF